MLTQVCGEVNLGCEDVNSGYDDVNLGCGEGNSGWGDVNSGCGEVNSSWEDVNSGCGDVNATELIQMYLMTGFSVISPASVNTISLHIYQQYSCTGISTHTNILQVS